MTCGLIDFGHDIQANLTTYFDNVRSLLNSVPRVPKELYFQPLIMPVAGGPTSFALQFVWSAPPCDEQSWWVDKLTGLVPGGKSSVAPVTPAEHTAQVSKMVDYKDLPGGESRTVCTRGLALSPQAAEVVARYCALIPSEWGAVFIHMLHGQSVTTENEHPSSVFANRETSLMIEILGFAYQDESVKDAAMAWCKNMYGEMTNVDGVMDKRYFPLTQRAAYQAETTYGEEELLFLRTLKTELDPTYAFSSIDQLAQ